MDGLLVAGIFHPRLMRLYKAAEKHGISVVTMFKNTQAKPGMINVFCDDLQVGYLPTRHLLEQGCRRIAHIRSMDARYQGYAKAFGLHTDFSLIYPSIENFGMDTGRDAVRHWIENGVQFDSA